MDDFFAAHLGEVWDFWRRRESACRIPSRYQAFGFPVEFSTNHPRLLEGAAISAGRFSQCLPMDEAGTIQLSVVLDERLPLAELPSNWPERLRYYGIGPWLTINAEPWVNAFADLDERRGLALVSPSLLEHPYLYSRFIMDGFILNLVMRHALGQLHASCVHRDGTALLLSATHNSGKSTTAFRLALAGYDFLSDGMTYVRAGEGGLELLGYPVGEVKLRLDMIDKFPILQGHGMDVMVREDKKVVFNLRRLLPGRVLEGPLRPTRIILCLVERTGNPHTRLERIDPQAALPELWPEMTHLDAPEVMQANLRAVYALLEQAQAYRMYLGHDENHILETLSGI